MNATVVDNLDYKVKTDKYAHKISCYESQMNIWRNNNGKDLCPCPVALSRQAESGAE